MAIEKQDLLKFSKVTELVIQLIEDESSENNEVKLLRLVTPVKAIGSLPATGPNGEQLQMSVTASEVYVGTDNIEDFLKDTSVQDGLLVYKGSMHLDVSKPGGRTVNGKFEITKPMKIWLTKVKFSRFGGKSRQEQQNSLGSAIAAMFSGGKTLNLGAGTAVAGEVKVDAEVVPNKTEPDKAKPVKNGQGKAVTV